MPWHHRRQPLFILNPLSCADCHTGLQPSLQQPVSGRIGTTNWEAERQALAKVEETYAAYDQARRAETGRDEEKIKQLEKEWKDSIAAADAHAKGDEFSEVVDRAGGVGMNAFTSSDATGYFYSLPSNQFQHREGLAELGCSG